MVSLPYHSIAFAIAKGPLGRGLGIITEAKGQRDKYNNKNKIHELVRGLLYYEVGK